MQKEPSSHWLDELHANAQKSFGLPLMHNGMAVTPCGLSV
jgi:hypothetical protein